jgi:nickel-dependent lactate racemase
VLSVMPEIYDDIWTASKGMYKMEPVVADGGTVIIYAPHIDEISYTHGKVLDRVGYHVSDYFAKRWDEHKQEPWGVLAHSTLVKGTGTYENGVEKPRVNVILATGIPRARCEKVNLGYMDPATIDPQQWMGRESEGILVVPRAGELLHRLKGGK